MRVGEPDRATDLALKLHENDSMSSNSLNVSFNGRPACGFVEFARLLAILDEFADGAPRADARDSPPDPRRDGAALGKKHRWLRRAVHAEES